MIVPYADLVAHPPQFFWNDAAVTQEEVSVRKALSSRSARLRLPKWLWGGDISEFGNNAKWVLEVVDSDQGTWRVRLAERRSRRAGRLVRIDKLAHGGNVSSSGTFGRLDTLPAFDTSQIVDPAAIGRELERIANQHSGPGPAIYSSMLAMQAASRSDLAAVIRQVMQEQVLPILPTAVTWLLAVDEALTMRFAVTRVLLLVQEDPDLLRNYGSNPQELVFNSARGLLSDTLLGLAAYVSPLLLALSPRVIGSTAARRGGVLVLTFGQPVAGRYGVAVEPLQLFHPHGPVKRSSPPEVAARDIERALRWWTEHLDALFTEITDPCNYRLADETFDVRAQFETLLSVEQAFRNVQSLLAADRDSHVARILCLDTLDTLEGLRLGSFFEMCRLSYAQAALREIEDGMPSDVARVLLPKATGAIKALESLQSGFFLKSRLTSGGIRLPDKRGGERDESLERAAALWLRVLRNAGHSFATRQSENRPRDEALLLSHDGDIPAGLADLAYLYVLRLVAKPGLLRNARSDPRLDRGNSGAQ